MCELITLMFRLSFVTCSSFVSLSDRAHVSDQEDESARFAVIKYKDVNYDKLFAFTARRFDHPVLSYICQLQQGLYRNTKIIQLYNVVLLLRVLLH